MKIKKYIPRAIGGVCLLVLAITALILIPHFTAPQEPESAAQSGYAVEGQQMIQTKEAAHGEDYEIVWADPALEQILRLYLNKADGAPSCTATYGTSMRSTCVTSTGSLPTLNLRTATCLTPAGLSVKNHSSPLPNWRIFSISTPCSFWS